MVRKFINDITVAAPHLEVSAKRIISSLVSELRTRAEHQMHTSWVLEEMKIDEVRKCFRAESNRARQAVYRANQKFKGKTWVVRKSNDSEDTFSIIRVR